MRLWHKDLIKVLPDKQLLGQWRECCAIAGNIKEFGSPRHLLVNRIMEYHLSHFYKYCTMITDEMYKRGFYVSDTARYKIIEIADSDVRMGSEFITDEALFSGWHDKQYMIQCYFNLQEKHDCGGISQKDWGQIEKVYNKYFL